MLPVCRKTFYEEEPPKLGTIVYKRAYPRRIGELVEEG